MEGIGGIGMIVSPVLGIYCYLATGFSMTFYIFSAAMIPTALLTFCMPSPKKWRVKLACSADGSAESSSEKSDEEKGSKYLESSSD